MSNQKEDSKPIKDNNTTQNSNTIINSNSTYENFNILLTKKHKLISVKNNFSNRY